MLARLGWVEREPPFVFRVTTEGLWKQLHSRSGPVGVNRAQLGSQRSIYLAAPTLLQEPALDHRIWEACQDP